MRKIALLIVLVLGMVTAHAQTTAQKIGYADPEYILSQMPEAKQIDAELKSTQAQLKNQIDTKAQEFQRKLKDYQDNLNNMIDAVRVNTERELTQLQDNLTKLQQDAQTSIQNKHVQLFRPVYDKIGKAIEDVAKENGYSLILSTKISDLDIVLYGDENVEVSDLVLKKMGITPKPATNTTATPPKQ
jgi:outer membrane protein